MSCSVEVPWENTDTNLFFHVNTKSDCYNNCGAASSNKVSVDCPEDGDKYSNCCAQDTKSRNSWSGISKRRKNDQNKHRKSLQFPSSNYQDETFHEKVLTEQTSFANDEYEEIVPLHRRVYQSQDIECELNAIYPNSNYCESSRSYDGDYPCTPSSVQLNLLVKDGEDIQSATCGTGTTVSSGDLAGVPDGQTDDSVIDPISRTEAGVCRLRRGEASSHGQRDSGACCSSADQQMPSSGRRTPSSAHRTPTSTNQTPSPTLFHSSAGQNVGREKDLVKDRVSLYRSDRMKTHDHSEGQTRHQTFVRDRHRQDVDDRHLPYYNEIKSFRHASNLTSPDGSNDEDFKNVCDIVRSFENKSVIPASDVNIQTPKAIRTSASSVVLKRPVTVNKFSPQCDVPTHTRQTVKIRSSYGPQDIRARSTNDVSSKSNSQLKSTSSRQTNNRSETHLANMQGRPHGRKPAENCHSDSRSKNIPSTRSCSSGIFQENDTAANRKCCTAYPSHKNVVKMVESSNCRSHWDAADRNHGSYSYFDNRVIESRRQGSTKLIRNDSNDSNSSSKPRLYQMQTVRNSSNEPMCDRPVFMSLRRTEKPDSYESHSHDHQDKTSDALRNHLARNSSKNTNTYPIIRNRCKQQNPIVLTKQPKAGAPSRLQQNFGTSSCGCRTGGGQRNSKSCLQSRETLGDSQASLRSVETRACQDEDDDDEWSSCGASRSASKSFIDDDSKATVGGHCDSSCSHDFECECDDARDWQSEVSSVCTDRCHTRSNSSDYEELDDLDERRSSGWSSGPGEAGPQQEVGEEGVKVGRCYGVVTSGADCGGDRWACCGGGGVMPGGSGVVGVNSEGITTTTTEERVSVGGVVGGGGDTYAGSRNDNYMVRHIPHNYMIRYIPYTFVVFYN